MKHLLTINDWSHDEVVGLLDLADLIKARPQDYADAMHRKELLMIFEKPSLRTRVSFEAGMSQMGGHAIHYDLSSSPLGDGKETIADMARVSSRFVDVIMARLFSHDALDELAAYATVPVINALTDLAHPCQLLADLQTIREKKGRFRGLRLAYFGDAHNNVTYSLMNGCTLVGMEVRVACPDHSDYRPPANICDQSRTLARAGGGALHILHDPLDAAEGADIIYTDSWMSYHIAKEQLAERVDTLAPFQVNAAVMAAAAPNAVFMNCLPAARGYEQTADVIDGPQSIVFDQAENRLHAQKAILIRLTKSP